MVFRTITNLYHPEFSIDMGEMWFLVLLPIYIKMYSMLTWEKYGI